MITNIARKRQTHSYYLPFKYKNKTQWNSKNHILFKTAENKYDQIRGTVELNSRCYASKLSLVGCIKN